MLASQLHCCRERAQAGSHESAIRPRKGFEVASNDTTTKLRVFVNRRKVDLETDEMTGAELLQAAEFEGQGWDLLRLQGEGDPSGGIRANP